MNIDDLHPAGRQPSGFARPNRGRQRQYAGPVLINESRGGGVARAEQARGSKDAARAAEARPGREPVPARRASLAFEVVGRP